MIAMELSAFLALAVCCAFATWVWRKQDLKNRTYQEDLERIKSGEYGI